MASLGQLEVVREPTSRAGELRPDFKDQPNGGRHAEETVQRGAIRDDPEESLGRTRQGSHPDAEILAWKQRVCSSGVADDKSALASAAGIDPAPIRRYG